MKLQQFDVNSLKVGKPCPVPWESMTGNQRVRRCSSCQLNIFNIEAMTRAEVEELVRRREGRLCIRLVRREDGTIATKDCPVGLRAYRKRVARFAGATLGAVLGLFSISFGQREDKGLVNEPRSKIISTANQTGETEFTGTVTDPSGAVIGGVDIRLFKSGTKKPFKTKTDQDGRYFLKGLEPGTYRIELKLVGFQTKKISEIEVNRGENIAVNVELLPKEMNVTVGIFVDEPLINSTSASVTTVITRRQIEKLPF